MTTAYLSPIPTNHESSHVCDASSGLPNDTSPVPKNMSTKRPRITRRSPRVSYLSRRKDRRSGKFSSKNLTGKKGASTASDLDFLEHVPSLPLSFQEACQRLTPRHQASLVMHLPYVLAIARRTRRPGAQENAIAALVKAIVTFRRRPISGPSKKVRTLRSWITRKVRYAMLNLAAEYPVSKVRDAVLMFREEFDRLPTLRELRRFSDIGPRQILNGWSEVADELGIAFNKDSIELKLRETMGWCLTGDPETDSRGVLLVRRVLQSMLPNDACVLILKEICDYSEQEILGIIGDARDIWQRTSSVDAVDARLDQALEAAGVGLNCPWDDKLFRIVNRGQLALRQLRARRRFRAIWRKLGGSRLARTAAQPSWIRGVGC